MKKFELFILMLLLTLSRVYSQGDWGIITNYSIHFSNVYNPIKTEVFQEKKRLNYINYQLGATYTLKNFLIYSIVENTRNSTKHIFKNPEQIYWNDCIGDCDYDWEEYSEGYWETRGYCFELGLGWIFKESSKNKLVATAGFKNGIIYKVLNESWQGKPQDRYYLGSEVGMLFLHNISRISFAFKPLLMFQLQKYGFYSVGVEAGFVYNFSNSKILKYSSFE